MKFSIQSTARSYPKLPYQDIKNTILGKHYELSLTFIGAKRAQDLNIGYRNKSYTPNVLSFPLTSDIGEIFITPTIAKKEAKKFSMSPNGYIGYLFIHACLHLNGYAHGSKMERLEEKYLKQFNLE